jgi:hypothetical protein
MLIFWDFAMLMRGRDEVMGDFGIWREFKGVIFYEFISY